MGMMQSILIAVLVFSLSAILAFACAFTATTLYISFKRRPIRRYHFDQPADSYHIRRDQELDSSTPTGIDGESAKWR